jgi:hypothetical protein
LPKAKMASLTNVPRKTRRIIRIKNATFSPAKMHSLTNVPKKAED